MKIKKTQARVSKVVSRINGGKVPIIDQAVIILNVKGEEYLREKTVGCVRESTDQQFSEIYQTIMPASDIRLAEKEDQQHVKVQ